MLSSYGDDDLERVVEEVEPMMIRLASKYVTRSDSRFHDLVQEGLVKYWQTRQVNPGQQNAYYVQAAKTRMLNVLGQRAHTGSENATQTYRPKTTATDFSEHDYLLTQQTPDPLDVILASYHYGQIMQALATLNEDDRFYVVQRFWHGTPAVQIDAMLGLTYGRTNARWSRRIRPQLVKVLAGIRD